MPSFFDLQKYAATGIASPDMTAYDKMRALAAFGGGKTQTLTGQLPLSFRANGTPLISWSMKGNGSKTGTPSPDNIIMPTFCGVRTAQTMPSPDASTETKNGVTCTCNGNGEFTLHGTASAFTQFIFTVPEFTIPISVGQGGGGTFSMFNSFASSSITIVFYDGATQVDNWSFSQINRTNTSYIAMGGKRVTRMILNVSTGASVDSKFSLMFTDDGQLPNKFEPYGCKIPLTNAGQTIPVYLGEVSTVRRVKKLVLDGTENITSTHTDIGLFNIPVKDYLKTVGTITNICSHYRAEINVNGWSDVTDSTCRFYGNAGSSSKLLYIRDSSFSTVADFKSYLAAQYAAGTPVAIWYVLANEETGIVNEPLCRVGDYCDELHSADTTVTIPTAKGANTLTVETDLQPSEMTITYT